MVPPAASEGPRALGSERGLGMFSTSILRDVEPPKPHGLSSSPQHQLHLITSLNKHFAYKSTR